MNNQIIQAPLALVVTPQIALAVTPPRRSAFKALSNKKKKPSYHFSKLFDVSDETNYDFEIYSSLTDHGDFD